MAMLVLVEHYLEQKILVPSSTMQDFGAKLGGGRGWRGGRECILAPQRAFIHLHMTCL